MEWRRQRTFLAGMVALAMMLILVGTWEWAVAGAVHQLLLGAIIFALAALAWFLHSRASEK